MGSCLANLRPRINPIPQMEVVVVTHNSAMHIKPCLDSIFANGGVPIVVDNASRDETLDMIRSYHPGVQVVATGGNLGYAKAINKGFTQTRSEFVVLSNPDVVYQPDSISRMVNFLRGNPDVGVTGPQQMFPDGSWQRSYGDLPGIWTGIKDASGLSSLQRAIRRLLWPRRVDRRPKEVPYLDGAVLVVRRKVFESLGGFDEDFYFYGDESDLCARLWKAGWRAVFFPDALVTHVRGADSVHVDRSDRFPSFMVESHLRVAKKHLRPWKVRVYARLQQVYFQRMILAHRFLRLLAPSAQRVDLDRVIVTFEAYSRLWRAHLRQQG